MTTYGLTPLGFVSKQQQQIISELQVALQTAFGQNINLLPEAVFGQLVGIFSEREALVWQLAEAVYASQYPEGAEGTSVDNILALNGLKRLPALPTKTSPPVNGAPGLLLFGTPGTLIEAGSQISINGAPLDIATIDNDSIIEASANAVQDIFFSSVPDSGQFTLQIKDPAGNVLTTDPINFDADNFAVRDAIKALSDVVAGNYPYTDIAVTGNFTIGFTVNFGAVTPAPGNPSSGALAQNLFTAPTDTLLTGSTVVNITFVQATAGQPSQVAASATFVNAGPIFAPAGSLTVIDTPVTGWTGVNNPIDCITGSNLETDTLAIQRWKTLRASQANGPIQAIVEKVLQVPGVTQCIGFENLSQAALQTITFSAIPTSGSFTITLKGNTTAGLPYTSTAASIQTALRAFTGFGNLLVTGNFQFGFVIDFNGSFGDQPQDLVEILSNSLGPSIVVTPAYGRPGKSFEIVVQGGDSLEIAQAIYASKPAGIQTYGNTSQVLTDAFNNTKTLYFSRPVLVPIYILINITRDTAIFPGDGVQKIQQDLATIGAGLQIGSNVTIFGSNGLVGAFNDVPGIKSYTLAADTISSPTNTAPIPMQPYQLAQIETFNIIVTLS